MSLLKAARSAAEFYLPSKRSQESLKLFDFCSRLLVQSKVKILNFWEDLMKFQSILIVSTQENLSAHIPLFNLSFRF